MTLAVSPERLRMGEGVTLDITLTSRAKVAQTLIVDYAVHFMRANGKTSPKVFKWTQLDLPAGEQVTLSKLHKLREVTTRKHYPGAHGGTVQINGQSLAQGAFDLLAPDA